MNFKAYKTTLLLMMFLPLVTWANKGEYEASKHYEESFSINQGHGLNIDGSFASFEVVTWDKNEINLSGDVKVSARNQKKADELVDMYDVQMSNSGTTVNLIVQLKSKNNSWNSNNAETDVQFTVKAPHWVNLEAFVSFGNLDIAENSSNADLKVEYGNLSATNLSGNNSKIEVNFGNASIENLGGGEVSNAYGQVTIDMLMGVIKVENAYGEFRVNDMKSTASSMNIENSFGETSMYVPSNMAFEVNSESSFGEVNIKGSWNEKSYESDFQSEEKRGTLGTGGSTGSINIENSFGEVKIIQK